MKKMIEAPCQFDLSWLHPSSRTLLAEGFIYIGFLRAQGADAGFVLRALVLAMGFWA